MKAKENDIRFLKFEHDVEGDALSKITMVNILDDKLSIKQGGDIYRDEIKIPLSEAVEFLDKIKSTIIELGTESPTRKRQ